MRNHEQTPQADDLDSRLSRLYSDRATPAFETAWRAAIRREESIQMTNTSSKKFHWRAAIGAFAAVVLVVGSLFVGANDIDFGTQVQGESATQSSRPVSGSDKGAAYTTRAMTSNSMVSADYAADGIETSVAMASGSAPALAPTDSATTERKLIRTAGLTIRTAAFEQDVAGVQALLETYGGYVEDLYQYGDVQSGSTRTASLSMRVPSDKLDAFLTEMDGVGRVTDRSETTTDMTVQYADNEARLQTLRQKMTRLNELLSQAQNVSDLIEIESAIADTQYQIDSYETSQRSIDRRVDMSAVNVTLVEETPADSAAATDVSLGNRISAAFTASVKWLGTFFRNMLVFVVMALPVIVPVVIIAVVVWLVARKKRGAKPADPDESKEE